MYQQGLFNMPNIERSVENNVIDVDRLVNEMNGIKSEIKNMPIITGITYDKQRGQLFYNIKSGSKITKSIVPIDKIQIG